jgi:hypothetical protein
MFAITTAFFFFLGCRDKPSSLKLRDKPSSFKLYDLDTHLESRSISFENPTGAPGRGGKTANNLGVGRKGSPCKMFEPNETITLCNIKGPGTIRHIWMTGSFKDNKILLRSMVIRFYWEKQTHPSIECPLGDFFGCAQARWNSYQSAVHSVGQNASLNIWLPMPFEKRARITLSNESNLKGGVFYQIDYTINDCHPEEFGRLHVLFRRENPTTMKKDFVILPKRTGKALEARTMYAFLMACSKSLISIMAAA